MDPPIENGITVNFGYVDYGKGPAPPKPQAQPQPVQEEALEEEAPEENVPEPVEEQPEETVTEKESEKLLTQETEESNLLPFSDSRRLEGERQDKDTGGPDNQKASLPSQDTPLLEGVFPRSWNPSPRLRAMSVVWITMSD